MTDLHIIIDELQSTDYSDLINLARSSYKAAIGDVLELMWIEREKYDDFDLFVQDMLFLIEKMHQEI
jgi:hypothetical protein